MFNKIFKKLVDFRESLFVKRVTNLRLSADGAAAHFYDDVETTEVRDDLDWSNEPKWGMEINGRRIYLILSYNKDFDNLGVWDRRVKENFGAGRLIRKVRVRNRFDIWRAFRWLYTAMTVNNWDFSKLD